MKCLGAVLRNMGAAPPFSASKPLSIEWVELDAPGPGEVLVRIHAAGLCHSDLSVIEGKRPRPMPMLLGHEAAGEVCEFGPGVEDLQIGERVVLVFMPSCGHCPPCAEGRPALCEPGAAANGAGTLLGGKRRISNRDGSLNHHLGCSAFSEYAVVSRRSLVKVDSTLSYEDAALFGCAVLTGFGAVVNTASIRAGQSVAIVGLGGVGLAALLAARCAGAQRIVAIDRMTSKLDLAGQLGATEVVDASDPDCAEQVRGLTSGGVDHAIETAGAVAALELAFKVTRRGGTTTTAGLPAPDQVFRLPPVNLVAEERTLKGSYIGTAVPQRDIARCISLFRQGRLPVDRLRSGILPLAEINEGFDRLHFGEAVRIIVKP
ncbi:MAG: zinc-dependent alcohol dehydrogenase family protein [Betaproteobacteria bacterium]|nr:zinc-dependent alcohol dehydrogenase family protein [Betaproteobacteria bacterium]